MGVAGWPGPGDYFKLYHTESDERRLADNERRRRILHPAWHRECDREVREPVQRLVETPSRPQDASRTPCQSRKGPQGLLHQVHQKTEQALQGKQEFACV
jgi:hypothetical protein